MEQWVGNEAAAAALGISVRQLQRLRADGVLVPAAHWCRLGSGPRARLRFDLPACWMALRARSLSR